MKKEKYFINDRDYFIDKFRNYLNEDKLNEGQEYSIVIGKITELIKTINQIDNDNDKEIDLQDQLLSLLNKSKLLAIKIFKNK